MGETGFLFSGSQLCTFNDDYCSQPQADCCAARCVRSCIKPLLPSSRTKTTGRAVPPVHRSAGLPHNVTLLRPGTTRSRRCHLQLGCVCFLPCLTLPQLENSSPGWVRREQSALWRTLAQRGEVSSAPLPGGTGSFSRHRDTAQVFSQAPPRGFFSTVSSCFFPFLPNSHLQLPLSSLDGVISSSFRHVRCLSKVHKSMWGDGSPRQMCLHFSITFMEINPLPSFPSSLSQWFKLLHYPKLAGNSGVGEKDVREGTRRHIFLQQQHPELFGPRDFAFSPPLLSSNSKEKAGKKKATTGQYEG